MLPIDQFPALLGADLPETMFRIAVAIALGFMIGSERERNTPDISAPGVRTFTLLTLMGALAVLFGPIILAVTVLVAGLVAISPSLKYRSKRDDPPGYGATTIAAAVVAPLVGALAILNPVIASASAVIVVVILASKERVHGFIKNTVSQAELSDAVKFFIVALVVLPLLPDQAIDQWGAINPHRIGFLVTLITGVGWAGYIATRALGAARGLPIAGLTGGLISSTATTASMAKRAQSDPLRYAAVSAALLAKVSSLAVLAFLVASINFQAFLLLLPPFLAMAVVLILFSRSYGRRHISHLEELGYSAKAEVEEGNDLPNGRAFALKPALILVAIITGTLFVARIAAEYFGPEAVVAVAALTGTVETHAATVAAVDLVNQGALTSSMAMLAGVAAMTANTILKMFLGFSAAGPVVGRLLAKALGLATLAMLLVAAGTWFTATLLF
jgi:uncharacterized membrane protein (DUF4010 family)